MSYIGDPRERKAKSPEDELKRLTKGFNEAWKKHSRDLTKVKRNRRGRKRQTPRFTV